MSGASRRRPARPVDDERVERRRRARPPRADEGVDERVRDRGLHVLVDHRLHERRRRAPVVEAAREPVAQLRLEADDGAHGAAGLRAVGVGRARQELVRRPARGR